MEHIVLKSAKRAREDRIVAGLILRDAKSQAELADEEGVGAYLGEFKPSMRVNERLLQGEVSQVRSFNRRAGVEPLPALPTRPEAKQDGKANALEKEFLKEAHQRRHGAAPAKGEKEKVFLDVAPVKKRQRLGAAGTVLDVVAAAEAEAKLAEEEEEFAHPLLKNPTAKPKAKGKAGIGAITFGFSIGRKPTEPEPLWPSKGLRVCVVAETGRFGEFHLKVGVVRKRNEELGAVDVELDTGTGPGGGKMLAAVPQRVLKTVVSSSCTRVEVVRGPHQGAIAEMVRMDGSRQVAIIRLSKAREGGELEVPVDDVCEFV